MYYYRKASGELIYFTKGGGIQKPGVNCRKFCGANAGKVNKIVRDKLVEKLNRQGIA